jgi:hypothetical protein
MPDLIDEPLDAENKVINNHRPTLSPDSTTVGPQLGRFVIPLTGVAGQREAVGVVDGPLLERDLRSAEDPRSKVSVAGEPPSAEATMYSMIASASSQNRGAAIHHRIETAPVIQTLKTSERSHRTAREFAGCGRRW